MTMGIKNTEELILSSVDNLNLLKQLLHELLTNPSSKLLHTLHKVFKYYLPKLPDHPFLITKLNAYSEILLS